MSIRTRKIASTLRNAVQETICKGLHDPRICGLISITSVDVAPDMSEAVINISVLPADKANLTLHGLRHAAGRIRSEVSSSVRLRTVPRLQFRLDESLRKQSELYAAISESTAEYSQADDEEYIELQDNMATEEDLS